MTPLKKFDISEISNKLNSINYKISVANSVPFPSISLLSSYSFKKKPVKIMPNGDIQGGLCKMITSLIDFSFIRSLTAPLYSIKSPPPYDPPTLFIADNPRLYNGIPRDTNRYNEIKRVRSASERMNSTLKENLDIINNPIVFNRQQADVLAQIAAIVLLLTSALEFIAKTSALFIKYNSTKDPNLAAKLMPHYVPPSIKSLIQRE